MALTDFYEIIDRQFIGSSPRPALNVYHVMKRVVSANAATAAQAFVDWVLPAVVDIQSEVVVHRTLTARNLGNDTDFVEVALGDVPGGIVATDHVMPSFVAAGIQFLRERMDIKHGWKRYVGITEANVGGNTLGASLVTTLNNTGAQIVTPWELAGMPGTLMFDFAIIARVCAEVGPLGGCLKYRLPENDAELEFYLPSEAVAKTSPRSQNTRKIR